MSYFCEIELRDIKVEASKNENDNIKADSNNLVSIINFIANHDFPTLNLSKYD